VGESVDAEGRRAFVTTLRAREQDIRRERATSNVCTNQTLMAVTAAVQMGWLGRAGLRDVATRGVRGAHYLRDALVRLDGVCAVNDAPFVREFALRLARPAAAVVEAMAERGFLAGVALDSLTGADESVTPRPQEVLVVAVTERRTRAELDAYVQALGEEVVA
jgi:glycine dehydrogenase subunit 1